MPPALKPICFVAMPFGTKEVPAPSGKDAARAPAKVDFDALWDKAYSKAIEELGYLPVRADFEAGTVIVKDMLERLAYSDLVLADVTIPSGNVYYEVGIRHAARPDNCVMFAADWSKQLFDIDQFRTVRYRLENGSVPDDQAAAIKAIIVDQVPRMKKGYTPYREFVVSQPGKERAHRKGVFREHAESLSEFQAQLREVRLTRNPAAMKRKAKKLLAEYGGSSLHIGEVAIELMEMARDQLGWKPMLSFAKRLPEESARLPRVVEQELLAIGKTGKPEQAIAKLERLIEDFGDSAERRGLIGGRYKQLWREAREERVKLRRKRASDEELRFLESAIQQYRLGMEQDYNSYYCSCNLPSLLVARNREADARLGTPSDREEAQIIDRFVLAACHRAQARDEDDGWTNATLLGVAMRSGNLKEAQRLAELLRNENVPLWQSASTLADLSLAVEQTSTARLRQQLAKIVAALGRSPAKSA